MIIQPKIRGFICTTAHPDGCARAVLRRRGPLQQLQGRQGQRLRRRRVRAADGWLPLEDVLL